MAWTAPRTWVAGEMVTAAMLNTHLRDNLIDLDRRTSPVENYIAAASANVSTTGWSSIGGPSVSATIGTVGKALVSISARLQQDVAAGGTTMGYDISGATARAPADDRSISFIASTAYNAFQLANTILETGLNAGVHTFDARLRVNNTSEVGRANARRLVVTPLGS